MKGRGKRAAPRSDGGGERSVEVPASRREITRTGRVSWRELPERRGERGEREGGGDRGRNVETVEKERNSPLPSLLPSRQLSKPSSSSAVAALSVSPTLGSLNVQRRRKKGKDRRTLHSSSPLYFNGSKSPHAPKSIAPGLTPFAPFAPPGREGCSGAAKAVEGL
jgi:hypothetical protein